ERAPAGAERVAVIPAATAGSARLRELAPAARRCSRADPCRRRVSHEAPQQSLELRALLRLRTVRELLRARQELARERGSVRGRRDHRALLRGPALRPRGAHVGPEAARTLPVLARRREVVPRDAPVRVDAELAREERAAAFRAAVELQVVLL